MKARTRINEIYNELYLKEWNRIESLPKRKWWQPVLIQEPNKRVLAINAILQYLDEISE